jgi:hypothetical protein
MGLGTEVDTSGGYLRFGHTGSNVGYGCFSFAWPGTAAGQRPVGLLSLPGGRYRLPGLDCEITFGEADGLPAMHIRQENTTQTATRKP